MKDETRVASHDNFEDMFKKIESLEKDLLKLQKRFIELINKGEEKWKFLDFNDATSIDIWSFHFFDCEKGFIKFLRAKDILGNIFDQMYKLQGEIEAHRHIKEEKRRKEILEEKKRNEKQG